MTSRSPARSSQPGPSTSNVIRLCPYIIDYVENTSSIDEAEALHSTMTSRSPARSSQPGPSTSNVIRLCPYIIDYVENTSSIDEAEALHTTMTSRSPARSSQPGPSTSNVIDSVMENEQLSSTQVGLNYLHPE